MRHMIRTMVVAMLSVWAFSTASADLTDTHVKIAMKSVKFLQPKVSSGQIAAFVYKEGDAASKAVAEGLAAKMDKKRLQAKVMSTAGLDMSNVRLVFVTNSALGDIASISSAAKSSNAAAVSASRSCSESGQCVLTVEVSPKIQIYMSTNAASSSGVSFSSAFMMLVKKH